MAGCLSAATEKQWVAEKNRWRAHISIREFASLCTSKNEKHDRCPQISKHECVTFRIPHGSLCNNVYPYYLAALFSAAKDRVTAEAVEVDFSWIFSTKPVVIAKGKKETLKAKAWPAVATGPVPPLDTASTLFRRS